jgi:hypothetical protein
MKLSEIAEGWLNFISQPEEIQGLIKDRLEICDTCPEKIQISAIGQKLLTAINNKTSIYKCGVCHCPLSAKTAAVGSTCPNKLW